MNKLNVTSIAHTLSLSLGLCSIFSVNLVRVCLSLSSLSWASPLVFSVFVYVSLYPSIPNSLPTTIFKALLSLN